MQGQEMLLPGQEAKFSRLAERYQVLDNTLLKFAGEVLERNSSNFQSLPNISDCELAEEAVKERTINHVNNLFLGEPQEVKGLLGDLITEGMQLQILGSHSRAGVLSEEELKNHFDNDFDIGISIKDANIELTPEALLDYVKSKVRVLFPDISDHISYMNPNGKQFFDPSSPESIPFAYTFNSGEKTYSFQLTFLDQEGQLTIDTHKKRTNQIVEGIPVYGNYKVPDTFSNPLDLIYERGEIVVDPATAWSELFLDTLVYGRNGDLVQMVGMPPQLLERFREDPHLIIYLNRAALLGKKCAFTPAIERARQAPLTASGSQLFLNLANEQFSYHSSAQKLKANDQIDIRAFLLTSKFWEQLMNARDLPAEQRNLEKQSLIELKALEEVSSVFSGLDKYFPQLSQLIKEGSLEAIYQEMINIGESLGVHPFSENSFTTDTEQSLNMSLYYDLDRVLDTEWNDTLRSRLLKSKIAAYASVAAGVLGSLALGNAIGYDNCLWPAPTVLFIRALLLHLFPQEALKMHAPDSISFTAEKLPGFKTVNMGAVPVKSVKISKQS